MAQCIIYTTLDQFTLCNIIRSGKMKVQELVDLVKTNDRLIFKVCSCIPHLFKLQLHLKMFSEEAAHICAHHASTSFKTVDCPIPVYTVTIPMLYLGTHSQFVFFLQMSGLELRNCATVIVNSKLSPYQRKIFISTVLSRIILHPLNVQSKQKKLHCNIVLSQSLSRTNGQNFNNLKL